MIEFGRDQITVPPPNILLSLHLSLWKVWVSIAIICYRNMVLISRSSKGLSHQEWNPFLEFGKLRASEKRSLEKENSDGKWGCRKWETVREGRQKGSPNSQQPSQLCHCLSGSWVHFHSTHVRPLETPIFQKCCREGILSMLIIL